MTEGAYLDEVEAALRLGEHETNRPCEGVCQRCERHNPVWTPERDGDVATVVAAVILVATVAGGWMGCASRRRAA